MSEYQVLYEGYTGPDVPCEGERRPSCIERFLASVDVSLAISPFSIPAAANNEVTFRSVGVKAEPADPRNSLVISVGSSISSVSSPDSCLRRRGNRSSNMFPSGGGVYVSCFWKYERSPFHDHPDAPRFNADQAEYSPAAGRL